jgi:predicted lipid-binding transport protein (Tim44 family)
MIAMLMGFGLSSRIAKLIAYVAVPLLIALVIWLALDAYGDSRYREGKKDEAAAWQEASDKLKAKAAATATKADDAAAKRAEEHVAKVEKEKEAVAAALEEGRSPFDALFPVDR